MFLAYIKIVALHPTAGREAKVQQFLYIKIKNKKILIVRTLSRHQA